MAYSDDLNMSASGIFERFVHLVQHKKHHDIVGFSADRHAFVVTNTRFLRVPYFHLFMELNRPFRILIVFIELCDTMDLKNKTSLAIASALLIPTTIFLLALFSVGRFRNFVAKLNIIVVSFSH